MIPVETPEIDIGQLAEAFSGGAAVVGVREPVEYAAGHVPGAKLIPMGQLPGRAAELDLQAQAYVVCASGHRSRHDRFLLGGRRDERLGPARAVLSSPLCSSRLGAHPYS